MKEENIHILNRFSDYGIWVKSLHYAETDVWCAPISKGKWSVSAIIAHITNWDRYLLQKIIPSLKKGDEMTFPDFDSFNHKASMYADSGISQQELIQEAVSSREALVDTLMHMPEGELTKTVPSNGVTHCPNTGEPYSLIYIIQEFIEHDHHHKQQIIEFLSK
ncbi:DinB family protein [Heyndrickxia acidicola]|uniref:DinB family protein n=1 Tax=Heyndrickxia acidicola TaxID=209389 RepID=A0ABU6MMP2_9BACI|nr:DinB family protein [Heyndrickxia acidicola]MED1205790.1 DinB family protein [Heyndrickxia acidicola]